MTDKSKEWAAWLEGQRRRKIKDTGDPELSWSKIARETNIHPNTLLRWKDGFLPRNPQSILELCAYFGDYGALDIFNWGIDRRYMELAAWAEEDEGVARVLERLHHKAEQRKKGSRTSELVFEFTNM